MRDGEREGGQFLATESWRKREVDNLEVTSSNPGSTTFYKMGDFVLFNHLFRVHLKCIRQFSFQISNLVHRTLGRSVNIRKVFFEF